jgi:hypothetical protein
MNPHPRRGAGGTAKRSPRRSSRFGIVALIAASVLVAACTGPGQTHPSIPSLGPRPSSPATVAIVAPENGSSVSGETTRVQLRLDGARIVPETTTELRPDEGHVHLYVDGSLVSMNYGLEQDIPVQPGTHVLKAEFVATDHAPFNPRIWSSEVIFTVTR